VRVSNPKMMRAGNIAIRKSGDRRLARLFAPPVDGRDARPTLCHFGRPDFLIGLDSPGDPVVAMSGYG